MKNRNTKIYLTFLIVGLFTLCLPLTGQTSGTEAEKQAIQEVIIQSYVEGLQNEGDTLKIDAGFHPGFQLLGIGEGDQMWALPIAKWRANVINDLKSGKKPKMGDDMVSVNFVSVDVTGNAAVAKLDFFVGDSIKYVDYISLYKFESGWKIVSKIFYKLPE